MLKKNVKLIIALISIILVIVVVAFFQNNEISINSKKLAGATIVPVESVAFKLSDCSGFIGIRGTVNKIVDDKTFLLGCQDACVAVPVKYDGKIPKAGQELIIYGQLSNQAGKYVFLAETLKPIQNDK